MTEADDEAEPAEYVSVVLPVYNAASYLDAAISSILEQSHRDLELLAAVDAGSSDASGAIVEAWASRDPRVRPIHTPHVTPAAARLLAARQARGRHIAFMDTDDISLPHRLEAQLAHMRRHDLAICGCLAEIFGTSQRLLWFPQSHEAIVHEQLFRFALFTPALMMRADVLSGLNESGQRFFEDYEWWNERLHTMRAGNVPEVLYRWRSHDGNASKRRREEMLDEWRRGRERCFFRLFPDASADDFDAFNAAAEKRPHRSTAALDRAGKWLTALADVRETAYRERLALRWRQTCMRAAALGPETFRTYRRHSARFGTPAPAGMRVHVLSLMRLSGDSLLYRIVAGVARGLRALTVRP